MRLGHAAAPATPISTALTNTSTGSRRARSFVPAFTEIRSDTIQWSFDPQTQAAQWINCDGTTGETYIVYDGSECRFERNSESIRCLLGPFGPCASEVPGKLIGYIVLTGDITEYTNTVGGNPGYYDRHSVPNFNSVQTLVSGINLYSTLLPTNTLVS